MATLKDLLDEQERQKQLLAMMAMGGDERALGNYPPPPAQQPSQGNYSDMFDPSIPLPPARQYTGNTLADIARNPDPNWSQETKDALARRADLSGTLRVSHNGNDVSGLFGGSGNQPQQPTFRNTLQVGNNAPVDLGQSQTAGLSADWARPVDVMGAKGHWASDNSGRIILRDGRIVDPGRDTGEERKRRLADAEIAKREAEVRNLNGPQESTYDKELAKERAKAGVWSVVESAGKQYMLNNKTGEIKPAVVNNAQLPAKADAAAKPTEDENKTAYHASKMLDSINRISQLSNKSKDAMTPGLTEAMAASTAGPYSGTANVARSGDRQAVFGLQTDLVDSLLYLATGAAYNKEQLDQKRESLLPSFTDKPEAIAEKKRSLQEYMKAAKIRSGKAWKPEMEAALNSIYADGAESPKAKAPPANGTVKGGYVFIGGDPAKESSWKKVQ